MRAVHDRGAELDRLDRILAAMRHQRAAHEHDWRKPIEQAEFAHRVGDIDVGRGVGNSSRERSDAFSRAASTSRAIAGPRSGCRGTITVSSCGKSPASALCVSIRISSSPGWVEAATMIGRPRVSDISRSSLSGSAGGAGTSSLRLPVATTLRQPSAAKRSASVCDCARQRSKRLQQRRDRAGTWRQRGNERSDIRPLTRTIGSRARGARSGSGSATDRTRRTARGSAASDRESARRSAARRAARIDG